MPEAFDSRDEAAEAAVDAGWAVIDGKLLCADCTPENVVVDDEDNLLVLVGITATTTWTIHCGTCNGAYIDGETGSEVHLYERTLDEWTLQALTYSEWEVTETAPPQGEALFDVPDAPKRTWQVTCPECIAEAAWLRRLAAAAA
ncbi:hypothetical protein [Glycomyces tenuis]|uniref:hypothetical protein n=1 Tax=Glycomyces tenuis TaxID=58116 RepID=UPI00040F2FA5|nr:hypothetical protein [Glycomyces tenuis]